MTKRTPEYLEAVKFVGALGFEPGTVQSVHIDHDGITVVGFETDNGRKVINSESNQLVNFVVKFSMFDYDTEEDN